jgi:hypothetical protein
MLPEVTEAHANASYSTRVRLSWLMPDLVVAAREALLDRAQDWEQHFTPTFAAGDAPAGFPEDVWPRAAEFVARAERVSAVARTAGLEACINTFRNSPHACELATLVAAAAHVDMVTMDLLEQLFRCEVDELVAYGDFLALLSKHADQARVIATYEHFCGAVVGTQSAAPDWQARVSAVRDGLASLYVTAGREDDAHAIFLTRHTEDSSDVAVALTASRSFLAGGLTGRAVHWLEIGARRARDLGRSPMERTLLDKAKSLRKRLS